MGEKESSIIKELQELKKLLDDGTINKEEFEIAKKRILDSNKDAHEENVSINKKADSNSQNYPAKGLNRKATFYDFLVVIIIIASIVTLKPSLIGGVFIGIILGGLSQLIANKTKSNVNKIFLFILFSIIFTSVCSFFISIFSSSGSVEQEEIDRKALDLVYSGRNELISCRNNLPDSATYISLDDCLHSSNIPTTKFDNTSCNYEINAMIQGYIDAKEHCGKVSYYEKGNGGYVKEGISPITYANEVSECNAAIDQIMGPDGSWECGEIKFD